MNIIQKGLAEEAHAYAVRLADTIPAGKEHPLLFRGHSEPGPFHAGYFCESSGLTATFSLFNSEVVYPVWEVMIATDQK